MTVKIKELTAERWWDVWIAIFAMALVIMVSGRLWVTEWTGDLYIIVYLTFLAGLTGLGLGFSQFSPLTSALISTYYGLFSIVWLLGTTISNEIPWRERILNHYGWRLRLSIEQFNAGQAVTDPILFLSIMAILLWLMSSTATFILVREGSVWPGLIPLGITLLVISHYDQDLARNMRFLMTFIFFTLVIIGRMNFLRQGKKWRLERIQTTPENHADLTRSLIIIALVLVILAWIIPITPQQMTRYTQWWQRITEPWDRFRERFADILVLETATETTLTTFFGETLGLGTGSPISEEVVFSVQVDTPPPAGYRNYWFTRSYDLYVDNIWSSTPGLVRTQQFPENFTIAFPPWEGEQAASYTFTSQSVRLANLYATGTPTWISRPVETITQILTATGEGQEPTEDLVGLLADPELFFSESYQVETLVSVPTASDLRATSIDYPTWLERYLQLPDDFSPRVASLATSITRSGDHPYDKAMDITRYLRINIEYARTIPPVPAGSDPMEWFLFEEQTGFCNYYATAQVLMLRSLGIPTRFVVGYAQGEYDPQTGTYTVRKQDSHAWPEVYFIDYGWMPFEPTVDQPALIRPVGIDRTDQDNLLPEREDSPLMDDELDDPLAGLDEISMDDQGDLVAESEQIPRRFEGTVIVWVMLGVVLFVLLAGIFILQRPELFKIDIDPLPVLIKNLLEKYGKPIPNWLKRWSDFASMSAAERAYRQLCRAVKIMGQPLNPAQTPSERARVLTTLIPQAYQPALVIVSEYHLDKFSTHYINEVSARSAGRRVLGLALETRLRRLFAFGRKKTSSPDNQSLL
jgi:transglutaminase-like putative cysteine protease